MKYHSRSFWFLLVLFAFLATGCGGRTESSVSHLGNGVYRQAIAHYSDSDSVRPDKTETLEGTQDSEGKWHGKVTHKLYDTDKYPFDKVEYRHGERHGWSVYYDRDSGKITSSEYYQNGTLAEPPLDSQTDPVYQKRADAMSDSIVAAGSGSIYQTLEGQRPWFIHEVDRLGFPPTLLTDFLADIEANISKYSYDISKEKYFGFNWTASDLGNNHDLPYYDFYNIYQQIVSTEELGASKKDSLRLAIIDRYRTEKKPSTFDILQASYPRYLMALRSYSAMLSDIRLFADELDRRLDALSPLNINDPLFPSEIDKRIATTINAMQEEGVQIGRVSMALASDYLERRDAQDPLRLAAKHFYYGSTYPLSVTTSGSGTVTNLSGIDCGNNCIEYYVNGSNVTLTAVPDAGARFQGWEGDCSGKALTCTVKLTQKRMVFANFIGGETTFNLSISKIGSGRITSSPQGIECGTDCAESYAKGTSVTLTAVPFSGSRFVRWEGACKGTAATCTITVNAAKRVAATFKTVAPAYTLTVSNIGSGAVTGTGIDCGYNCTESYAKGTSVMLTATPLSGFRFVRWEGACEGTEAICAITMNAAERVVATFETNAPAKIIFRPGPGRNGGTDTGSATSGKDASGGNCESPATNFGAQDFLYGGPQSNCNGCNTSAWLQFDVSTLPDDVTKVYLGVTHQPHTAVCYSNCNADFYFYPVTSDWDEMTVSLAHAPEKGAAAFGPINIAFPNDFGNQEYEITGLYRQWKSGAIANHGIEISSPTIGCNNASVGFHVHSSDSAIKTQRPYLRIITTKP